MNTVLLKGASAGVFLGSQYIVIYKALGLAWVVPTQSQGCDGAAGCRNTTSIDCRCDLCPNSWHFRVSIHMPGHLGTSYSGLWRSGSLIYNYILGSPENPRRCSFWWVPYSYIIIYNIIYIYNYMITVLLKVASGKVFLGPQYIDIYI